jgi:hypothetical protein
VWNFGVDVSPVCILRGGVYSVAICWCAVDFMCVLLFCIVFIYGVKYRILEIE